MKRIIPVSLFSLMLLVSLGGAFAQVNPQFDAIPASFGINSPNPVYAVDIPYDNLDLDRQVFHLFLPDTTGTYPLVAFIHGGGFTGGSPDVALTNQADVTYFLEKGFAFASFGYRLLETTQADTSGVLKCLNDAKRALQFVRYYADDLNIDPDRIALMGSSAGAGTSLWLGTRDDMADPDATDPISRESTRVCAVVANGSQATYDLYKWETQVYQNFDGRGTHFTLDSITAQLGFERASNFYGGLDSVYQIVSDPFFMAYRQEVDMLYHMSSDDPPVYITNASLAVHPGQDLFHHAFHGRELHKAALAANLPEVKADIRALGINTTNGESRNDFLVRNIHSCSQVTSVDLPAAPYHVNLYPNPATDQFTVSLEGELIKEITIYSPTGHLISKARDIQAHSHSFSIASVPSGIYIVYIKGESGINLSRKIIIQ